MPTSRAKIATIVFASVCCAAVLLVGFWPIPVDLTVESLIERVLAWLHDAGVPTAVNYGFIEFSANILFFVPVGIALAAMLPRGLWWVALPAGVLLSAAIELGQLWLRPDRFASWSDVAANSLGTALGVGLVLVVRQVSSRRYQGRRRPGRRRYGRPSPM